MNCFDRVDSPVGHRETANFFARSLGLFLKDLGLKETYRAYETLVTIESLDSNELTPYKAGTSRRRDSFVRTEPATAVP